jgi:hypothetical protein
VHADLRGGRWARAVPARGAAVTRVGRMTAAFDELIAGLVIALYRSDHTTIRRIEEIGAKAVEFVGEFLELDPPACPRLTDSSLCEAVAPLKRHTAMRPPRAQQLAIGMPDLLLLSDLLRIANMARLARELVSPPPLRSLRYRPDPSVWQKAARRRIVGTP